MPNGPDLRALKEVKQPSQYDMMLDTYGQYNHPEAVALRSKYLQPLLSGDYKDALRHSFINGVSPIDFGRAFGVFLGLDKGAGMPAKQQAQSLGADETLAQYMAKIFGGAR